MRTRIFSAYPQAFICAQIKGFIYWRNSVFCLLTCRYNIVKRRVVSQLKSYKTEGVPSFFFYPISVIRPFARIARWGKLAASLPHITCPRPLSIAVDVLLEYFSDLQSLGTDEGIRMLVKTVFFYIAITLEAFIFCFAGEYLSNKVSISNHLLEAFLIFCFFNC